MYEEMQIEGLRYVLELSIQEINTLQDRIRELEEELESHATKAALATDTCPNCFRDLLSM
ncbi:MAG: hypothetical protein EBR82_34580 [Caulobacteraceae bacterium]|jgi:hypothetical protein|nr:hypothetical protein [Caulobacteraceae bacterium]